MSYEGYKGTDNDSPVWYLKVRDDMVYGPITFNTLYEWVVQGRVLSSHTISNDQQNWMKAESLPELKMEWMVSLKNGEEYGPFNILAAPHLVERGIIEPDATLRNRNTGKEMPAKSLLRSGTSLDHQAGGQVIEKQKVLLPQEKKQEVPAPKAADSKETNSKTLVNEEEIKPLHEKLRKQKEAYNKLRKDSEIRQAKLQKGGLVKSSGSDEEKKDVLKGEIAEKDKSVREEELTGLVEKLSSAISEKDIELARLSSVRNELENEIKDLKEKIKRVERISRVTSDKQENTISEQKKEIERLQKENAQLAKEKEEACAKANKEEVERLVEESNRLREEKKNIEAEKKLLNEQLENFKKEIADLQDKLTHQENSYISVLKEREDAIAHLTAEAKDAAEKLKEKEQKVFELVEKIREIEALYKQSIALVEKLSLEKKERDAEIEAINEYKTQLSRIQEERDEVISAIRNLTLEFNNIKKHAAELEGQLDTIRANAETDRSLKEKEIKNLTMEKDQAVRELGEAKTEIQKLGSDIAVLLEKNKSLEAETAAKSQEISKILAETGEERNRLEKELLTLRNAYGEMEKKLIDVQENIKQKDNKIEELKGISEQLRKDLSASAEEKAKTVEELNITRKEKEELANILSSEKTKSEKQIAEINSRNEVLQKELADARKLCEEMGKQSVNLQDLIGKKDTEIENIKNAYAKEKTELEREIRELRNRFDRMAAEQESAKENNKKVLRAVSYTHLTLPTIYSV